MRLPAPSWAGSAGVSGEVGRRAGKSDGEVRTCVQAPAPWSDVELHAQRLPSLLKEFLSRQFYDPRVFYLGISYCPVCCE